MVVRVARWGWRVGVVALGFALFLAGVGVGGAGAAETPAPVRLVRSVSVSTKAVALTFDDGPSPQYTPEVLQLLTRYGARATFFLIGSQLLRYPQLARQEAQDGMELANHGARHLTLQNLDPSAIAQEVKPVEAEITAITGNRPTLYRLPQGKGDARSMRALADLGYTIVYCSTIG